MNKLAWRRCIVASLISWLAIAGRPTIADAQTDIVKEDLDLSSRIRGSSTYFRFTSKGKSFSGYGLEFAFDRALSKRWAASASVSQAYTLSPQFGTLFTALDVGLWYSLWGDFTRQRRLWRDRGAIVAEYVDRSPSGLRLGLGTQQFFFNAASGAIPFSGLSAKLLYDFGLDLSFDLAIGVEAAQLVNTKDSANATRCYLSIVWPLE